VETLASLRAKEQQAAVTCKTVIKTIESCSNCEHELIQEVEEEPDLARKMLMSGKTLRINLQQQLK
jgi:CTP-dependent riboflavin kinase|tara:strand:+ start:113 stop:310 length:198 start_codon:yes stop_codon:yes gene_type:complete